ncbi:MAG: VWA domain-containing protein [Motiliproteus sp.]
MLTLAWPWLLLLLPLPWLIRRFSKPFEQQQAALQVPFYDQLNRQTTSASEVRGRPLNGSLLWLIWLLLLIAAARPLWLGEPQPLAQSGRNLMLAVDISGSMKAEDMQLESDPVNRLVAVKAVLQPFIERRSGDRLGLILFGSNAYMQTPLTFDHSSLNQQLQEAQIGFAGDKTAIGDAIGLAVKRLRAEQSAATAPPVADTTQVEAQNEQRVLILLTDGANTEGQVTPLEAAAKAAEQGIKIYTLGFGADEMQVRSLFGRRTVNPSADLDEATLTEIASSTGGRYFRARNIDQLQQIYQLLDQLEPSQQSEQMIQPQQTLFHWPLSLALLLSLALAVVKLLRGAQPWRRPR